MARVGWQQFRVYPIEHIAGHFPKTAEGRAGFRSLAFPRETFWKRTLHAFLPTGFCSEGKSPRSRRVRVPNLDRVAEVGAWQGRAAPLADGVGRTFLSRDFDRKVRFLLGRVASGSFSQAELQGHADRNLRRMYDALFNSDAQTWGVDDAHRTSLMASILFSLPSVSNAGVRATFRSLIVQLFLHPAIEKLGFNRIVADDSLWLEKRRGYRAFVDQDCGHVVTTDLSLVRNPTIESLMARGTMFRAKPHEGLGAEGSMPEAAFLDLERALQAWRFSVSKALGVSDASALVAWVAAVRAEARTVIDSSAGGESFVGGCEDPHLVLTASDWRRLREVQRDFVITTVDKAAGNFCFVCKKHYMQKCLDELRHGVAYEATERSADDINAEGTALCRAHSITPQRGPRIPHFHIRVKLHKSPVGYRFVAGANRATLTPVSKWLSVAFRALTADTEGLWKEVVSQIPGLWHLAVNGDGHLGALDDGMWLSLWYPSDGYCLFEGVGDSSAAGSFYVQCLGAFSPAGGLVVDSHVMGC
ncbi:hypothetical protein CYMTET_14886 [Cymbomonas tetramitiformis]|uniref:Uncharacterized protein n=1 Tax=Cymbomonas tetramitiformis TaxID=36881 RepID=A0AAE0GGP2_9CHLO|nr:hypothetical protein CYMTET_14886 [Cymbomonas tetramitiformis]